jgi:chaperonin cofactor prefoldin
MNQDLVNQLGEFTARVLTLEAQISELHRRIDTIKDSLYHKIEVSVGNICEELYSINKRMEE